MNHTPKPKHDDDQTGGPRPVASATTVDSCTPKLALRSYQLDCLTAIEMAEARGVRRPLVTLPAGTGFARKQSVATFLNPSTAWRKRPASDGQLAALSKMQITVRASLTAGEASDLISQRIAAR